MGKDTFPCFSCVTLSVEALLQHVTYCSGISLLLLAVEETGLTADGNERQEMASIYLQLSPKEPFKGESLKRNLCLFVTITVCETPSGEGDSHPSPPPHKMYAREKTLRFSSKECLPNLKASLQTGLLSILLYINI